MIDTHVHFWDIHLKINTWVNNSNREDLKRSFTLDDYLQHYSKPEAIVTIEAADANKTLVEVEWIKQHIVDNTFGIKIKHMPYIDFLQAPDKFVQQLALFKNYSFVCGFRQIFAYCEEDVTQSHNLVTHLKHNLALLKEKNYIFDCQMHPNQLLRMCDIFDESGVAFVIDHAGMPKIDTKKGKQQWLDMLQSYANTSAFFKLTEYAPEIISGLLEYISIDKLLIGSNYPVSTQNETALLNSYITKNDINAHALFKF
ncbi:MAG: amidohydrolase family protein [Legionellales bacterium]|jgi:predicted TIM-barrel fold metal-dependent hydrolase